jgi:hypothetical protein
MAMPRRHGDPRPALGADDDDDILPVHGLIKLITTNIKDDHMPLIVAIQE